MADSLILEVAEFEHDVLTGIYSEETGRPQPLRFTVSVRLNPASHYAPDTPLTEISRSRPWRSAASIATSTG